MPVPAEFPNTYTINVNSITHKKRSWFDIFPGAQIKSTWAPIALGAVLILFAEKNEHFKLGINLIIAGHALLYTANMPLRYITVIGAGMNISPNAVTQGVGMIGQMPGIFNAIRVGFNEAQRLHTAPRVQPQQPVARPAPEPIARSAPGAQSQ